MRSRRAATRREPASCATGGFTCASSQCTSSAIRAGWPVKIGIINAGLLPDVGEGINGSPVVAPLTCPEGGEGLEDRRHARRRARLHPQPRRQLLLRLDRRPVQRAADRLQRGQRQDRHAGVPGRRRAVVRHARRHARRDMFAPVGGPDPRARRRRARLPEGRPGLHRRLERQQRPVRAGLPGGQQRPVASSPVRWSAT